MKRFGLAIVFAVLAMASAFSQTSQGCHKNGLFCSVINATITPRTKQRSTATQVINGVVTPVTGTLTFAPGPSIVPAADDYDDNGNPICYKYDASGNPVFDANGNQVTVPCTFVPQYSIVKWDITVGGVHLVHDPTNLFPPATNSMCGNGYSNSQQLADGNWMYYICGNGVDTASAGLFVLVIPQPFFNPNNVASDVVPLDPHDGAWDTGVYLTGSSPAGSFAGTLTRTSSVTVLNTAVSKH